MYSSSTQDAMIYRQTHGIMLCSRTTSGDYTKMMRQVAN